MADDTKQALIQVFGKMGSTDSLEVFVPPPWNRKDTIIVFYFEKAAQLLSWAVVGLACFQKHGDAMLSGPGSGTLNPVWIFPTVR